MNVVGDSYAYVNLNVEEKELEELGETLNGFPHLNYLNLSKNSLKDIKEVTCLPNLLTLNASAN
jgi:Leucine-rich repeat (LRR) protein